MSLSFANYKRVTIPEGRVKQISRKSDGLVLWREGYTNRVPQSINADGSIYNGAGYKSGYRVRSGGAEGEMGNATCTGFIKVEPGDIIRFSGWDFKAVNVSGAVNSINVADSGFANIGQITSQPADYGIFVQSAYAGYRFSSVVEEKAGVYKWIVPPAASGAAYIRITAAASGLMGADMIVTVNEEIT